MTPPCRSGWRIVQIHRRSGVYFCVLHNDVEYSAWPNRYTAMKAMYWHQRAVS